MVLWKSRCLVTSLQVLGFGEVYGVTKNGFGANQGLYTKMMGHIENHGKSYIVGGDHNMEPKELAAGLADLGFQPQPVYKFPPQPTCFTSTGASRCLDFFVVSNVLAVTCIEPVVIQQHGLATHVPVKLTLKAAMLQETGSVLIKFDRGDVEQRIGPMQCFDQLLTGQYWPVEKCAIKRLSTTWQQCGKIWRMLRHKTDLADVNQLEANFSIKLLRYRKHCKLSCRTEPHPHRHSTAWAGD